MANVDIVLRTIDQTTANVKSVVGSFTELSSLLGLVERAAQMARQAIAQTVGVAVDYANQVRTLQLVSGQTAEETSRMIQVFDDFKISAEQLTPAIRAMTNNGLTPSLEVLAQLSDEYRALESPVEKNTFLLKNFGRTGLEMAEMMSKGGDAIREMGDAVNDTLIQTQEAQDAAREYELAIDELTDASEGLKIQIGNALIPVLTELADTLSNGIELSQQQIWVIKQISNGAGDAAVSFGLWGSAARDVLIQLGILRGEAGKKVAVDFSSKGLPEIEKQLDDIIDRAGDLNFIMSFQMQSDNFEEDKERILGEMEDLRDKIIALRGEIAAGTADAGAEGELASMEEDMRGLTASLDESKAAFLQWQKQAVFSLMQAKLAAGGLSDEEFNFLLNMGEEMGLLDPAVVEQAQAMLDAVSDVDADSLEDATAAVKYLVSQDGKTITIYVNQIVTTTETGGTSGSGSTTSGSGSTTTGGSSTTPTVNLTFNSPGFYPDILASLRG